MPQATQGLHLYTWKARVWLGSTALAQSAEKKKKKQTKNHLCALFAALGRLCTQPVEMDGAISGPQGVFSKLINGSRTQCLEESFRAGASRAIT